MHMFGHTPSPDNWISVQFDSMNDWQRCLPSKFGADVRPAPCFRVDPAE